MKTSIKNFINEMNRDKKSKKGMKTERKKINGLLSLVICIFPFFFFFFSSSFTVYKMPSGDVCRVITIHLFRWRIIVEEVGLLLKRITNFIY